MSKSKLTLILAVIGVGIGAYMLVASELREADLLSLFPHE